MGRGEEGDRRWGAAAAVGPERFRLCVAQGAVAAMSHVRPQVVQQIGELLEQAKKSGKLVSSWKMIKKVLTKEKLCWVQKVHCDQIAVHMKNRTDCFSNQGGWGII